MTYNVADAAGNKAIEVVRKVTVTNSGDTTAPVIVLLGDPEITLRQADTYTDVGATTMMTEMESSQIKSSWSTQSIPLNWGRVHNQPQC